MATFRGLAANVSFDGTAISLANAYDASSPENEDDIRAVIDVAQEVSVIRRGVNVIEPLLTQIREYNVSVVSTLSLQGPWGGTADQPPQRSSLRAYHRSIILVTNSPEDIHSYDFLNTSIPIVFGHASFLTATGA